MACNDVILPLAIRTILDEPSKLHNSTFVWKHTAINWHDASLLGLQVYSKDKMDSTFNTLKKRLMLKQDYLS